MLAAMTPVVPCIGVAGPKVTEWMSIQGLMEKVKPSPRDASELIMKIGQGTRKGNRMHP
jgi:hypothetical protein